MTKKQAKEKMNQFYLPTNWMRFYIYWRFPIGLIIDGIRSLGISILLGCLSFSVQLEVFDFLWSSLLFVLLLSYYGFCVVVYRKMKRLDPAGYRYNQILLGLNTAVVALGDVLELEPTSYDWETFFGFVLIFTVIALIWWLPNYLYFKKRKELFNGKYEIPERVESEPLFPERNSVGVFDSERNIDYIINVKDKPAASKTADAEPEHTANDLLWECGTCGNLNPKRQNFCPNCGNTRNLEQMIEIIPAKVQRSSAVEEQTKGE